MESMDYQKVMKERHSVRAYTTQPIPSALQAKLQEEIHVCNQESGLHIQLRLQEPEAFSGFKAHYGKFQNAVNYIVLAGDPREVPSSASSFSTMEETAGYYGERLVLYAQHLGLRTCWVGGTFRKSKCIIDKSTGEKLILVISIGFGADQGKPHRSKPMEKLCESPSPMPSWFLHGMEAAMLAPTAINQQKFKFKLLPGNKVEASTGIGPFSKLDLGIAKYHFEIGADPVGWEWA